MFISTGYERSWSTTSAHVYEISRPLCFGAHENLSDLAIRSGLNNLIVLEGHWTNSLSDEEISFFFVAIVLVWFANWMGPFLINP